MNMHIVNIVRQHFDGSENYPKLNISAVATQAKIPYGKLLRYVNKDEAKRGELWTDELTRLLIVLGYQLTDPRGRLVFGAADNIIQDIGNNMPGEHK